MKPVEKQVTLPIEAISIRKGEYLTAWLSADDKPHTGWQVELRVTPDGIPQVFVSEDVEVKHFNDWYSIPD